MRHLVRWTLFVLLCVAMAVPAFANCDNPTVVFPAHGSIVTPNASETVLLQWSTQVAAAQYDVYFGPVGSGCSAAPHATVNAPLTEWSPPSNEISPSTQYEWKVIATGAGLVSCPTPPQTPCSTFTTSACPVAPTLSAPGNNSTVPFGNVTLDWNTVPNATSYDVYGGLDGDPLSLLGTVTASQKVLNIEPGRVVEWKVVANAPSCPGQASAHFFFTTTCPTAPANPLTPATGATVAEGANVNFSWSNVAGATSYDVKVSTDNGGTWLAIVENHNTNSYSTDELEQGEYLWEIRANFDGDCDPLFSTPRALTIGADCSGTQAPALVSPPHNATRTSPVTFQWSAVAGVQSYRVFVQRTNSNIPVLLGTTTATDFTTSDLEAGTYDWKVVARFADCADEESSARRVVIESNCPTTKPQLIAPANGATDVTNNVLFRWSGVANATGYRVIASLDGAAEVELASTTNTQAEASVGNAVNVVWSVRAILNNNCSARSDSRSFTMRQSNGGECSSNPGKATLVAPANGATSLVSPITFDWNAVPNATGYRVFGSFNGNAAISLGFTTQTQLTADVPAGTGSWIVQTFFGEGCPTSLSDRRNFAVATGATCGDAVPQLIMPANGASNIDSPVEFKWSAVQDATLYRVFVAAGDDEFSFYGETEGTSLSRLVPAGVVRWYVLASFAACPEARSATASFIVRGQNECPNATITLVTPSANASTASPVHMSWSAVAGAQFYRVWISIDGAAPVDILRTNATEAQVPLPAGAMKWYVDAPRENCRAVVSNEGQFEVLKSASCGENAAPTLVSPVGTRENPAAANNPVTLLWNAVPNAIGYRIWISKNLVAFEDVVLTQLTQHQIDLEPGTYAWFAQALFAGCDPTSSPVAYFRISQTTPRCPTGEPSIISPGEGADVTSPVTIAWTAVDEAVKYRVFVSIDGSDPLLIGATDETELTHALPPGNVIVSVEAVFRECPSTFSDQVPFRIQRNQGCADDGAELVSPVNNTTNVGSPVTFVWNAVSGAVKYVLVAQVNDGAPTAIAATEATHFTHEMPAGLIRWHVVTFFSGCDPVTSSQFRFTIARDQDCNNRKPILLLPNDGSEVPSPVHFQWTAVPN
ncbi:MAG TPA: hypothetical protein VGQ76_11980, partial [Thermoanaerobaculia bacterium]|nr:hypothetical protein [Thermoanaerobaculia bacterium]